MRRVAQRSPCLPRIPAATLGETPARTSTMTLCPQQQRQQRRRHQLHHRRRQQRRHRDTKRCAAIRPVALPSPPSPAPSLSLSLLLIRRFPPPLPPPWPTHINPFSFPPLACVSPSPLCSLFFFVCVAKHAFALLSPLLFPSPSHPPSPCQPIRPSSLVKPPHVHPHDLPSSRRSPPLLRSLTPRWTPARSPHPPATAPHVPTILRSHPAESVPCPEQ